MSNNLWKLRSQQINKGEVAVFINSDRHIDAFIVITLLITKKK